MNLEYAAYLLNEDYSAPKLLLEDADSKARKDAIKWLKANYEGERLGDEGESTYRDLNDAPLRFTTPRARGDIGSVAELIVKEAAEYFGHPLRRGYTGVRKGYYGFLPGAIRVALSECGWMTKNVNWKMMENLRDIYAAIYFDYYDNRGPYHPDEQGHMIAEHPNYSGLCNNDFDGRTYDELMSDFGSLIPATKQRLQDQWRGATAEEETGDDSQSANTDIQRQAGQYHIEFIPSWEVSQTWLDYTSQIKPETAGCRWCLCEFESNWVHYHDMYPNVTIYFCWKAESKEALMDMNNHIYEYCPKDADWSVMSKAPWNEYGLSLICVRVRPDDNGGVKFIGATGRYNHVSPDGEFHQDGDGWGDTLVRPGDTKAICEILGITEEEFPRIFKIKSSGAVDHTGFVARVNRYKAENNLKGLFDDLYSENRYYKSSSKRHYSSDNNYIIVNDQNEYNLLTFDGTLVSPGKWFGEIKQLTPNLVATVEQESGLVNFLRGDGTYVLPREVLNYKVIPEACGHFVNYAKIEVRRGLWNLVNLNTGAILLKRPVADILLSNKYGRGIFVKKTQDSAWEQIDIKGKTIFKLANNNPDTKPLANIGNIALVQNQRKECSLVNTSNGRTIWKKKYKNPRALNPLNLGCFVIIDEETGKSDYISTEGEILDTVDTTAVINSYTTDFNPSKSYIVSKNRNGKFRIFDINNKEQVGPDVINRIYLITTKYISYQDADSGEIRIIKNGREIETTENEIYVYVKTVDADNEIYVVRDRNDKYSLFDGTKGEPVTDKFEAFDIGFDGNDGYFIGCLKDENKISLYEKSGEIINDNISGRSNAELSKIRYIGHGCFLIEFTDNKCNIITSEGKYMFKIPFNNMLGVGFNNEGIATISAGRNQYVINTDGDVSRNIDTLLENRLFMRHNNILVD
jgi:hypothetical protein